MKIKVKIKHIVLTGVAFILFLPMVFYLIQPQFTIYMAKQQMGNGEQMGKEKILDLLDDGKVFREQRFALIREYLIEGANAMEYDVYVGTTSTFWSDPNQAKVKFSFEERLPYLLEYVEEGPIDGYMETAASELAGYYSREGAWKKGNKVLQTALDRGNKTYFRSDLATKQIDLAVQNGQYELALKYIEDFNANVSEGDTYTKARAVKSHADILMSQGEHKKLLALVEEALADIKRVKEESDDKDNVVYHEEEQLKEILDRIKNGLYSVNTVRGKVLVNSSGQTPMEGVGVYLRDKNNLNYSIGSEETYQSVTNNNGEYVFKNVPSGSYQLRFGFTFDQIDGFTLAMPANPWIEVKDEDVVAQDTLINPLIEIHQPVNSEKITDDQLHFSWEPVEGAAYYSISVGREVEGGSVSHGLKSGIKNTEHTVSVEDLYFSQGVIQYTEDSDWKGIDYSSVLGFADPRGRFFWNVEAYNEKGDLITQSQGYRLGDDTFGNLPTFYLKNRELSKADKVLLKNKPEEALEMYKQNYAEDPDDLHSLLMISKIIGVEETVLNKSSKDLAITYVEKLAEKAPNEILFLDILQYYYEKENWQAYEKWYERFKAIKGNILNEYIEGNHAMALLKQEKYEEARLQFQLVMEQGYRHEYISDWIALELLSGKPFDKAAELAQEHPEQGIYDARVDWELLIKNLQQEEVQFDGYMEELEAVLEWHFKEENERMADWLNTTDKIELKRFIEELRK
ncbi:carboxypeptidase-like regulatory domain-containing protein [Sutcliffiella horikoshii]|uniref:carboxypeptidase-like regulatory domain-containing protein n=1 Tax=Sutcliffiella horikoshii TaxID=79883 RepID=UPI001CFE900E|nr:carboxypeptidase-like regulatory domain-containing protein [Sutcliffiella horikoshii]